MLISFKTGFTEKAEKYFLTSHKHLLPPDSCCYRIYKKTFLVRFPPNVWNSSKIPHIDIKNRRNNSLERYNRRLYDFFASSFTNICSLAEMILDEFKYYEERCAEIRQNFSGIVLHPIPSVQTTILTEFNDFYNSK
ncbi:hypothetical protein HZS_1573 [Henneguya salminicola]|nr:hypothetical protein HZS_1573 [Henneguya salminicola]